MTAAGDDPDQEGRAGIGRIEAFSDGVVAIIVTIMVLELHPPVAERFDILWSLWPVFLAYILSYAFVAIYWVNHHRLFSYARRVTNALLWANILLLFTLSLVPFATAYLGEHHFSREATWLYLGAVLLPGIVYPWLQGIIRRTGRQDAAALAYHLGTVRKGHIALGLYVAGLALTALSPWLGIACAGAVAILWFLPSSGIDRALARPRQGG
ncbi:TMEM175 family protein [Sphingomonas sp.]|uniref:TMEM175 family protein n=1 Tax=Sphingomonas sp. TaxID=28214 RepID=UPI003CC654D8